MKINNPHDVTFRDIFSDTLKARELIEIALSVEITEMFNWQSLVNENESFIDEELKEFFSDILFSVNINDRHDIKIYLLFEHKSYPDPGIWKQLLSYLSRIYNKMDKLTPVIPIVFYHGETEWKISKNFIDSIELPEDVKNKMLKYIPDFEYALIDLRTEDVDEMLISLTMKVVLYTFQNIRDFESREKLENFIKLSKDLFYEDSGLKIIQKLLLYLYATNEVNPVNMKEAISRLISNDKGNIAMTTAEKLMKEGFEQGIKQGIEKGIEEAKEEDAVKMLKKGYPIQEIAEITGLPEAVILRLKKEFN